MSEEKVSGCNHSFGKGPNCDGNPEGVLCYVAGNDKIPRVEISCEKFMDYHSHHGGILVLVAMKLEKKTPHEWKVELTRKRESFQKWFKQEFTRVAKDEGMKEKEEIEKGTMAAYDALIQKL